MTTLRQMVASPLNMASEGKLREWYQNCSGQDLPIKFLHLTFIPPFMAAEPISSGLLSGITIDQPGQVLGLGFYEFAGRKNLHIKIGPNERYESISRKLEELLAAVIALNPTGNVTIIKPKFEAHVTLDYDYQGGELPNWELPKEPIYLGSPKIYTETAYKEWGENN